MNELKEPLYKRIGYFVIDHSTALAVVILLVVVLLASLSKASAAESNVPDNFWDVMASDFKSYGTSVSVDYIKSLIPDLNFLGGCRFVKNDSMIVYFMTNYSLAPGLATGTNSAILNNVSDGRFSAIAFMSNNFYPKYLDRANVPTGTNSSLCYRLALANNGNWALYYTTVYASRPSNTTLNGYVINSDNSYDTVSISGASLNSTYSFVKRDSSSSTSGILSDFNLVYTSDICQFGGFGFGVNSSSSSYVYIPQEWDSVFPSSVSDDRLKLWTINNDSGSQELVIDFTDFGTDTSNSSVSYSSLTLDIEVDGVSSKIEYLDNYIEKVGNPLYSSQDILAYIPYSVFDIDSALNAKVTGVSFIKQLSTQSGEPTYETFNIAVDYYLKQEVSSVSPEPIVKDPDTVSSKLTVSEITSVRNLNNYGSLQFHDVDAADIVFPENFDILFVSLSDQSSALTVLDTVLDILSGLIFDPDGSTLIDALQRAALLNFNGITSESAAHNKIMDILGDQFYSTVFDVIYFTYDPGNGDAYTYWYYFTEAGRLRVANSYLADIYVEANQSAYTLGSIYDYLYERLNDFEEKSLIAITGSNTLLAKSNEWLQSILNAVNNIRVPDYSGSFSSIISGIYELNSKSFFDARLYNVLSAILTKLDNWPSSGSGSGSGSINNETYERFTAWLDGVNDLDGIMTPEELANDQFGLIGDLYSYFAEGLYSKIDSFDIGPISFARDLFDNMKSGSDQAYYNFDLDSIHLNRFR